MHTVYRCPLTRYRVDATGYRSVIADQYIQTGSVLLIEHLFSAEYYPGSYERATAYLHLNPSYANELCPRDMSKRTATDEEIFALKLQENAFMEPHHGRIVLGNMSTWFNHSYDFNAVVQFPEPAQICIDGAVYYQYFMVFLAWRALQRNEEITLMYNENVPFPGCPRPNCIKVPNFYAFHKEYPSTMVFTVKKINYYMTTSDFRETALIQIAAANGLMFHENTRVWHASEYFLQLFRARFPGCTIAHWLEYYRNVLNQFM